MSSTNFDELDTRTRILAVTLRLMEERGGQGVRISDIAQAAGLSRQAVYLHFENRTELLIATVRYADEVYEAEKRIAPLYDVQSGEDCLAGVIEFWGGYIPQIHGLARALLDTRASDEAAAAAWEDRMQALRKACQTAIAALDREGKLRSDLDPAAAIDLLWSLLDIGVWEDLTLDRGRTNEEYTHQMREMALRTFVERPGRAT